MSDRVISIDLVARDEVSARIQVLNRELVQLRANVETLSRATFDPFSRSQAEATLQALNARIAQTQKSIAELNVQLATVGGQANLQGVINSVVGSDHAIKSAAVSAQTLKGSLGALAAEDAVRRDASIAAAAAQTAAQAASVRAVQQSREAETARIVAMIDADNATFRGYGRRVAASQEASGAIRRETEDVDTLARRLVQLQPFAEAGAIGAVGLAGIEELKGKIAAAIAGGAQGASPELAQVLGGMAGAERTEIAGKLLQDSIAYTAAQQQMAVAVGNQNRAELTRLASLRQTQVALGSVQQASSASVAEIINATTGVSRAAAFSAAQIAEMARAWPAVGRAGKEALNGLTSAHTEYVNSLRHGTAIVDGALRGQRGQVEASSIALLRDSGLMKTAIEGLAGPWGAFAAAAVAALAVAGYVAEQAYQRFASIRETQAVFALRGGEVSDASRSDIAAQFDRNKQATNEYAGAQRALEVELNKLPASAKPVRQSFEELAKSLSGLPPFDKPEKAIADFVKTAEHGPDALARFATQFFDLRGAVDSSGKTLEEHVAVLASTQAKYETIFSAIRNAHGAILDAGAAGRTASNSILELALTANFDAQAFGTATEENDKFTAAISKSIDPLRNVKEAGDRLSESVRDLNEGIKNANKPLRDRIELLNQLAMVTQGAGALGVGEYGIGQRLVSPDTDVAAGEISARLRRMALSPAQEEEHRRTMQNIAAEAQARKADLDAQVDAARRRVEETERVARIKLPGGDLGLDTDVQKARQEFDEVQRRRTDQTAQLQIDNLRAVVAEDMRGTQERVNAQEEIITITEREREAGRKSVLDVAQERVRLGNLKRQLAIREFQEARDNARAEVELAKNNVNQIIAAYDKLRQEAARTRQPPAVEAQINREEIRDLQRAQQQAFTSAQSYESSLEKLDQMRISANRAALQSQVSTHQISKAQMEAAEERFTASVMASEEQRVEALINTANLTDDQYQKLYEHLAQLYEKDAERQLQAQAKITADIEAENQKRIKSFTTMFDAIGSGFEKLAEQALTRSATRQQAFREFGQSIAKAVLTEVGHAGSQFIGEKIAPLLNVKTEGMTDTSIGAVLSRAIGDALGITKTADTKGLEGVNEKMSRAVEAQQKASEYAKTSVGHLEEISKKLSEISSKMGPGSPLAGSPRGSEIPRGSVPDAGTVGDWSLRQGSSGGGDWSPRPGRGSAFEGMTPPEVIPPEPMPAPISVPTPSLVPQQGLNISVPSDQAQVAVDYALSATGEKLKSYCAILVNQSLEAAGVTGTGSGLASSFKTYGTPVAPEDVRKGDIFYAGPSGMGDTGHVGFAEGPIQQGYVPVISSHMQGAASNPAGSEWRAAQNLMFRRPDYGAAETQLASSVQQLNTTTQASVNATQLDASNSQQLGSKVATDQQSTDQDRVAIDKNTQAIEQLTQKQTGTSGGGKSVADGIAPSGAGSSDGSSSRTVESTTKSSVSSLGLLTQGLGIAATAAAIFGSHLSTTGRVILGAVGMITQLSSFAKNLSSAFDATSSVTKTVTAATTLEQSAKTVNAAAFATDTAAVQTNAAAQASGSAAGGIGGIFKAIPIIGSIFTHGGIGSAAEGAVWGRDGQLGIFHAREMTLPPHLSIGLQNMIERGGASGSGGTANFNYNANVTGYHPYGTKSAFESMLRTHGTSMQNWAENLIRNRAFG
jgi:hypothetical protein